MLAFISCTFRLQLRPPLLSPLPSGPALLAFSPASPVVTVLNADLALDLDLSDLDAEEDDGEEASGLIKLPHPQNVVNVDAVEVKKGENRMNSLEK